MTQPIEGNAKYINPAAAGSKIPATGERRRDVRQPVEMSGVIEFGDEMGHIDCKVVNISNSGAQLSADQANKAPEYFRLYIKPLNMVMDCRVMWRKENRMGVYFLALAEEL
ncbi:MAG: PilZ domain-containing protein [Rhizobiales bacterium]|nr:PilZ domain-containing protein [Hyphomicrobiales bacterium]